MRRLALILAVLAALAVPAGAGAQSIPVRLGGEASSLVGVPFEMPVVVDMSARSERLGSYALRLSWDPTVLRLAGGSDGTFGSATVNGDSATQGVVRATGASPAGAVGAVTVLVARFEPLRAAETTIGLEVTELFAAGTFADLLPSVVASGGLFCPARGRYGDIDADRSVNSRDALIALSNAVGLDVSAFDITLGDVDASGTTNARDALVILSSAVGLGVSGFRVNALVGGTCVAGTASTLVITPGAVGTVLPGQMIQFVALAREASGALQAAANVSWRTTNAAIASILGDGTAVTRDTGTVTITAVRDGRDSAGITVHVGDRRAHYVSAAAVSAVNQIGTLELPWASPSGSHEMMRPGDTLVILPGRYTGQYEWGSGILVSGRSSGGEGVVFVGDGSSGPALRYEGTGTLEVRNLTVDGYDTGIEVGSGASVSVDSVRFFARPAGCGNGGIVAWGGFERITVRRSQFVGDGQWDGCADGISVENGSLLEVEDVTIADFGDDGISALNTDSVVVRRANVHDNGYSGIDVGPAYYIMPSPAGGPRPALAAYTGSTALVVEDSRLLRNYYEAVYAESIRLGRISGTVVEMLDYDDAIYAEGTGEGHGYLELVGDSLSLDPAGLDDWISASGLDSVRVDGVRVVGGYDGYFYNVGTTRARNSSFRLASGTAFDVGVGSGYGLLAAPTLDIDSVHVVGLPSCDQCATGVYAYGTSVQVNRFRGENLFEGVYTSDSGLTVTNSVIGNTEYGIYAESYSPSTPALARIKNVTMTDVYDGIETQNMRTVIDTVDLTRGYAAVYAWGGGADTVRASRVTDHDIAIEIEDASGYVADNEIVRPWGTGLHLYGPSGAVPVGRFTVLRNTITCDAYGADYADAIHTELAHVGIVDNTVSGCNSGIWVDASIDSLRSAVVRGNIIAIPPQADYPGIKVRQQYRAEVVGNTVSGGGRYAGGSIRVAADSTYRMPWARVDSNVVTTPLVHGIVAWGTDTLSLLGNRVEDFDSAGSYLPTAGAISLSGWLRGQVVVRRNVIRRSTGMGIAIAQYDTALVLLDSNAVSGSTLSGIRLQNGHLWLRGNNVRNNLLYGVEVASSGGTVHRFEGNAFKGNGLYAVYSPVGYDSVDASGNWWGVDGMPAGATGTDSVFAPTRVTASSPLAADPSGDVPLAPPTPLAARPSPAPAVPAAAAEVTARRTERPVAQRPARPERTPKPAAAAARHDQNRRRPAAATQPDGAVEARTNAAAATRQASIETRARREAERAARENARTAERERHRTERRSAP